MNKRSSIYYLICGSKMSEPLFCLKEMISNKPYQVDRCCQCGYVFNGSLVREEIHYKSLYGEDYFIRNILSVRFLIKLIKAMRSFLYTANLLIGSRVRSVPGASLKLAVVWAFPRLCTKSQMGYNGGRTF